MALLGIDIKIYIVTLDELVYPILLMMKHDTKLITFPSQSIYIDNISNFGLYSFVITGITIKYTCASNY
jgi:hypothetical protein